MQQAYVSAAYCHKWSAKQCKLASRAGKLYDNNDFSTCKFDAYCVGDIIPWDKTITHIFGHGVRIGRRLGSTAVDVSSLRLSFPRNMVGLMFSDVDKGGQIGWTMEDN